MGCGYRFDQQTQPRGQTLTVKAFSDDFVIMFDTEKEAKLHRGHTSPDGNIYYFLQVVELE